jgi:hypothetical protein
MQRDSHTIERLHLSGRSAERCIGEIKSTPTSPATETAALVRVHPMDGGAREITGRVLNVVPLRNRRNGVTTHIAEGLAEWRWGDRVGYGWSEYLDHVG